MLKNKKALEIQGLFIGDPAAIRTRDPQLRRLLLYPAELRDRSVDVCSPFRPQAQAFFVFFKYLLFSVIL